MGSFGMASNGVVRTFGLIALLAVPICADTKSEAALRAQIAAAESRADAAVKARAALEQSMAKAAATSAANALSIKLATDRNKLAATASSDAERQAKLTQDAAAAAKLASEAADRKADTTNKALAALITGFWGLTTTVLMAILAFAGREFKHLQDRREAKKDAAELKATLDKVEVNTNSMSERLQALSLEKGIAIGEQKQKDFEASPASAQM